MPTHCRKVKKDSHILNHDLGEIPTGGKADEKQIQEWVGPGT